MGLDISHGAFSGAYSAFNRFRQVVAELKGMRWPPHKDSALDPGRFYWPEEFVPSYHPGLMEFFTHSDCDGEISPEICLKLADELEQLLPEIEQYGFGAGHIRYAGGYAAVTKKFIAGCRDAAKNNECLEFR